MAYLFAPPAPTLVPVADSDLLVPIHRVYCVGRNFSEHAREMGMTVDRGSPIFFCKPADAVVAPGGEVPYASVTRDLHHEVELVVLLGRDAEGEVAEADALGLVAAYSVGIDLTRRDLQAAAKAKGLPWDCAKGFDASAPVGALHRCDGASLPQRGELWLEVNGALRQRGALDDMVFSVREVIVALSRLFRLRAGDLIFMGTPSGVAALQPGDQLRAGIDQHCLLELSILPPR